MSATGLPGDQVPLERGLALQGGRRRFAELDAEGGEVAGVACCGTPACTSASCRRDQKPSYAGSTGDRPQSGPGFITTARTPAAISRSSSAVASSRVHQRDHGGGDDAAVSIEAPLLVEPAVVGPDVRVEGGMSSWSSFSACSIMVPSIRPACTPCSSIFAMRASAASCPGSPSPGSPPDARNRPGCRGRRASCAASPGRRCSRSG